MIRRAKGKTNDYPEKMIPISGGDGIISGKV
jgi:hypothetical protein